MKIALVHDQLREFGGAERVLVELKKIFPAADIYTSSYQNSSLGAHSNLIKSWNVIISWFGKIPVINKLYSPLRFLTPLIWENFDFSNYDLVISSTGSWMCKGIKTRPKGDRLMTEKYPLHISSVHHPPRYLYGYETAVEWQKHWPIRIYGYIVNHFLRIWDFQASQRPDFFIANSEETRKRIQKFYRRDAIVIYPPVYIPDKLEVSSNNLRSNYYITVSRLARSKHVDILIKAANKMKFNLKVIGTGRDEKVLKSLAGPTVEFLGNVSDVQLQKIYEGAKAFLFASVDEEFGIAPVEAMGYGLPVIAYKSGGLPETVIDGNNGYLYTDLTPDSLIEKIQLFEKLPKEKFATMKKNARNQAEKFTDERFKKRIMDFVNSKIHK